METRILFLGSNPSHKNTDPEVAFDGTKSGKSLNEWIYDILPSGDIFYVIANVSNEVTAGNKPLTAIKIKSNLENVDRLLQKYRPTHIVTLGNTASQALTLLNIGYFQLPHPSPLNRKLNDKTYLKNILKECKDYLCK